MWGHGSCCAGHPDTEHRGVGHRQLSCYADPAGNTRHLPPGRTPPGTRGCVISNLRDFKIYERFKMHAAAAPAPQNFAAAAAPLPNRAGPGRAGPRRPPSAPAGRPPSPLRSAPSGAGGGRGAQRWRGPHVGAVWRWPVWRWPVWR